MPFFPNNNLRYYKTEFVASAKTDKNRRLLTELSTELLEIKEDCYTEVSSSMFQVSGSKCRIFTNERGKYMIVVYHSRNQHEVTEALCKWINELKTATEKIRVYAFSPEADVLAEDFYEVKDKVNTVPLPDAIYNAYRATFKTLKLDRKTPAPKELGIRNEELGIKI